MTTKIIHLKPLIIDSCQHCLFCSIEFEPDEKRFWKKAFWAMPKTKRICACHKDEAGNHPVLTDIQTIPVWCQLENYEEEK